MDISKEISRNRTLLIVFDEEEYENSIDDVLKSLAVTKKKICYVCLNKTYEDVIGELKEQGIPTKNFFFIDVLSSYYNRQDPTKNCIFVSAPTDTVSIMVAIMKAVKEKNCKIVVFDTLSTLLIYRQPYIILRFTHRILQDGPDSVISKKVLIAIKGGELLGHERDELIKDIMMFADNSITIESRKEDLINREPIR